MTARFYRVLALTLLYKVIIIFISLFNSYKNSLENS